MKTTCDDCGYTAADEQFGDGCPNCTAEIPSVFLPSKKSESSKNSEVRLSVGTKRTFGNWTLFVIIGGETVSVKMSGADARKLINLGVPTQG